MTYIRSSNMCKTPEEEVRQAFIETLLIKGYPKHLIAVEVSLKKVNRRLDILCYGPGVRPLLLVECKAVKLTEAHMRQLVGYNAEVCAPFLALVNGNETLLSKASDPFAFSPGLPAYQELLSSLKGF